MVPGISILGTVISQITVWNIWADMSTDRVGPLFIVTRLSFERTIKSILNIRYDKIGQANVRTQTNFHRNLYCGTGSLLLNMIHMTQFGGGRVLCVCVREREKTSMQCMCACLCASFRQHVRPCVCVFLFFYCICNLSMWCRYLSAWFARILFSWSWHRICEVTVYIPIILKQQSWTDVAFIDSIK